jgi:ribonuclease T2
MKNPSLWLLAAALAVSPLSAAAQNVAGQFDTYTLAPNKNGDEAHSYGNCGVDAAQQELDRPATWCRLPEPELSAATRVGLTTVMPGVASCLDHHEWSKHGTCSGMSVDDYFAFASALVQQVAHSAFGRYLTLHAGETVDASAVVAAFEKGFGAGSGAKVSLNCTDVRGSKALLEVRLRLPNPPGAASELPAMLLDAGERGNCPSSFLLDPVPPR